LSNLGTLFEDVLFQNLTLSISLIDDKDNRSIKFDGTVHVCVCVCMCACVCVCVHVRMCM